MPWLSMYLVDRDVELLCEMLDADPEIALIRSDGPRRWKAQRTVPTLPDGEHLLWHIPSGPIELEPTKPKARSKVVKDPFKGWTEIVKPFQPGVPWVSTGPLGIFFLTVRRTAGPPDRTFRPTTLYRSWTAPASEVIGHSDLYWVGDHYGTIGHRPAESTRAWWAGLRRRIARVARRIPPSGPLTAKTSTGVWAFPHALELIRAGAKRADNPT